MAYSIEALIPEFREKVEEVLRLCAAQGVVMEPFCSLRSPQEQAKMWRQSRSIDEINAQIASFRQAGADFLADCLEMVGPQYGEPTTDRLPGFSWHQWGQAVDCHWTVDGKAVWSLDKKIKGINGYELYGKIAEELGLRWMTNDPGAVSKDPWHIQLRAEDTTDAIHSLAEINRAMRDSHAP